MWIKIWCVEYVNNIISSGDDDGGDDDDDGCGVYRGCHGDGEHSPPWQLPAWHPP